MSMPPPFGKLTPKAQEVIQRAHQLAVERGQNHINPLHLLIALVSQEESLVISILDKLEIDTMQLTESLLDLIEPPEASSILSAPSYNLYLTPEFAQIIEQAH